MGAPFDTLIPDARAFFAELEHNNTRDWFAEHKPRYDSQLKAPAKLLMEALASQLEAELDQTVKTKLYRPHRDIRFSKDKTPYSVHLHILLSPQGNGTQPAYFFGISQHYVTAGAGLMGFDKTQQAAWRSWVSEREGAHLQARIDAVLAAGGRLDPPELKRVPAPFDKEHAQADLLRRKSLTLWKDIEEDAKSDLPKAILDAFSLFAPVIEDMRAFL